MLNMLKCKLKCIYHMSIDQVTIFVLKSFSNLHVLKLFSNLFHKLPAWYASDLKPKFMVWHFGRRILLSERRLWLFYLVWTYIACIWVIDHSRPCKYTWHQIWRYIFHPHRSAAISFTPPPSPNQTCSSPILWFTYEFDLLIFGLMNYMYYWHIYYLYVISYRYIG